MGTSREIPLCFSCFVFVLTCWYMYVSFSLCLKLQNNNTLKGFIFKSFTNLLPGNSFKHVRTYTVHVAGHILRQILPLVYADYMAGLWSIYHSINIYFSISKLKYNCITLYGWCLDFKIRSRVQLVQCMSNFDQGILYLHVF